MLWAWWLRQLAPIRAIVKSSLKSQLRVLLASPLQLDEPDNFFLEIKLAFWSTFLWQGEFSNKRHHHTMYVVLIVVFTKPREDSSFFFFFPWLVSFYVLLTNMSCHQCFRILLYYHTFPHCFKSDRHNDIQYLWSVLRLLCILLFSQVL